MDNIKLYEIDPAYIDYLSPHAPHLFHNAKTQNNKRNYSIVKFTEISLRFIVHNNDAAVILCFIFFYQLLHNIIITHTMHIRNTLTY